MSSIQSVIYQVDLTHVPRIYPTDNPEYYAQYCIDFQPETVPSVAAFKTEKQAHSFLIQQFGEEQYRPGFQNSIHRNTIPVMAVIVTLR